MKNGNQYNFDWSLLGDIDKGRPNLGKFTRLEIYRLMQFTLRDVIAKQVGGEKADEIFYQAGHLAGTAFYKNMVGEVSSFEDLIHRLQTLMVDMGIGILRVEKADLEQGSLLVCVYEDLDCSGLPETDEEVCVYDEGFLAGILECFTGKPFLVREIDCWCTGSRTCRFSAEVIR
jgi:predicted hydrocarbon binding protein